MQNFYQQAAYLIWDYSVRGKIADKLFCEEIINLFSKAISVDDYLKSWHISNWCFNEHIATYNPMKRTITIYIKYFTEELAKYLHQEPMINNKFDFLIYINSQLVRAIVHELTHAYQYKNAYSKKNLSLETMLYLLSFKKDEDMKSSIINCDPTLYRQQFEENSLIRAYKEDVTYYYSLPIERIAYISGATAVQKIIPMITKSENLINSANRELEYYKFIGYDAFCPTAYVLAVNYRKDNISIDRNNYDQMFEYEVLCKSIADKYNLSFEKRLNYGLPITMQEKEQYETQINRSRDFLNERIKEKTSI